MDGGINVGIHLRSGTDVWGVVIGIDKLSTYESDTPLQNVQWDTLGGGPRVVVFHTTPCAGAQASRDGYTQVWLEGPAVLNNWRVLVSCGRVQTHILYALLYLRVGLSHGRHTLTELAKEVLWVPNRIRVDL